MSEPTALHATANAVQSALELAHVDWDTAGDSDLLRAADDLARLRAITDAALVAVAERLETTDAATRLGWASAKDFLTHATGGRKGSGATLVRIAKQTTDLPAVRDAMATGDLSLAQASAIGGKVATLPHDPEFRQAAAEALVEIVDRHGHDATDLEHAFPDVIRQLDPDGTIVGDDKTKDIREQGAHIARFLSFAPDSVGGVRIKGYATAEEAELVKATLMPLAAPVTTGPGACGGNPHDHIRRDENGMRIQSGCPDPVCSHDGRDPREAGVRMWDALIQACRRLQAADSLSHAHGTSARLTVTIPYDALTEQLAEAGLLPSGDTLSATAVRRLACDAEIIPAVLGSQGEVLDVGRTQRLVTNGIWSALVLRDRHCAFPGCTRLPLACDAHHIQHWADGGPTSLDNLLLLCRKHHTLTHQSPWEVTIDSETRRPVWKPPPIVDDRDRFSYHPARPRHPLVA